MNAWNYIKTVWQDRAVQYPNRYDKSGETTTQVTLVANPGTVTQAGTPINATNLNNIEQGILDAQLGAKDLEIMYWMGAV